MGITTPPIDEPETAESQGGRPALVEVLGDSSHGRKHHETKDKTDHGTLDEHEMPELVAQTRFHQSDDVEHGCRTNNLESISQSPLEGRKTTNPCTVAVEKGSANSSAGKERKADREPIPTIVPGDSSRS